jgi:hemoglobin
MARTLFETYGGFAQISKVVMAFYDKALDSDILGPYFDDIDMRQLIDHQTKFIASVMGGPASFSNDALREVHAGLNIDRPSFEEMARVLAETLAEFNMKAEDVSTVMAQIEARAPVIITVGS